MFRKHFSKTIPDNRFSSFQNGFTLIELVMVIVLLGLLSFGAQSLFSSKDSYVDYLAKERLLTLGLLAQQLALGVSAQEVVTPTSATPPVGSPAEIRLVRSVSGELSFRLFKHQQAVQSYQLETPLPAISVDGAALAAGSTVTLAWNQQAEMSDASNHGVTIAGSESYRICFSASGYVYESAGICP